MFQGDPPEISIAPYYKEDEIQYILANASGSAIWVEDQTPWADRDLPYVEGDWKFYKTTDGLYKAKVGYHAG